MQTKIDLKGVYKPSEDVVARDIQGDFIIVPITSGVGDLENGIFTLNETGRAIWERLDGKRNLKDVAAELASEFEAVNEEIEKDVLGLLEELIKKKMVIEVKK